MRGHRSGATDAMRSHILTVREEYESYMGGGVAAWGKSTHCTPVYGGTRSQACADCVKDPSVSFRQNAGRCASAEKMTRWAKPGIRRDKIQQPRHKENQNAGNQGNDRLKVSRERYAFKFSGIQERQSKSLRKLSSRAR